MRCATRARSPAPAVALLVAAGATLAIPDGFRRVIDQGFVAGGGDIAPQFHYLLADRRRARARDRLPLLFRLDARRAGGRRHPRRGARQSAAARAALLRGEPAVRDRLAAHLRHGGDRDGGRLDRLGGAAQHRDGHRRHHLSVHARADADRWGCCSASRSSSSRSSCSAGGCATSRAAARTGSPMSARSSPRRWAR